MLTPSAKSPLNSVLILSKETASQNNGDDNLVNVPESLA
mgnify:CR=1 FL=1